MSFEQRFALVLLAAFFLASVTTSLAAALWSPSVLRSRRPGAPGEAGALALFRLLPAASALAITIFVLGPGYFEHEQRDEPEGSGYALPLLALGGLWILAASAARLAASCRRTSAVRREWLATARPVMIAGVRMPAYVLDVAFPLVAVLGVVRPRLFVSQAVLDACSRAEMTAILEHERAHVRRHDNAVRLLMDAAPDLFWFSRASRAVASAWHEAVEHRADDAATRAVDLASALVKVARMATAPPAGALPASALYRGDGREPIGARVCRLVGAGTPTQPRWVGVVAASAAVVGALVLAAAVTGATSRLSHGLLEITVSVLP